MAVCVLLPAVCLKPEIVAMGTHVTLDIVNTPKAVKEKGGSSSTHAASRLPPVL